METDIISSGWMASLPQEDQGKNHRTHSLASRPMETTLSPPSFPCAVESSKGLSPFGFAPCLAEPSHEKMTLAAELMACWG